MEIESGDANPARIILTNTEGGAVIDANNGLLRLGVNTGDMVMDASGNVGIGDTSTGTYKLVVDSGTAGNSNAEAGIFVDGTRSGVVFNLVSNSANTSVGTGTGIKFKSGGFTTGAIITRSTGTAASGDAPGYMTFHTSTDDSEDLAERMRIDSSGNLLVNKTALEYDSNVGHVIRADGLHSAIRSGGNVTDFNRLSSEGEISRFSYDGTTVGSIGVNSTDNLYFAGVAGSTKGIYLSDGGVVPANAGGAPLDDGANLGHTSYRFKDLYLSGGAYLGGTGSANALDDYEEGTFTPTLTNVGSYTTQFGKYTKIGRLVHVAGKLHATSVTVNGTTIILGGLPFDSADESDSAQRSAIRPEGDWGGMGIAFTDGAHFRINGTSAQGVANSGGSSVYWSHNASGMGTTMEFNFSGTYYSN